MANGQENLIPLTELPKDKQREIRSKGGKARVQQRREQKKIADALRQVLYEPLADGQKTTKLEGISVKAIKKIFDNPDIRDLKILAEILGELKLNEGELTLKGDGLQIVVDSKKEEKKLQKIKKLDI